MLLRDDCGGGGAYGLVVEFAVDLMLWRELWCGFIAELDCYWFGLLRWLLGTCSCILAMVFE